MKEYERLDPWQRRWRDDDTPWNLQGPHPEMETLWERLHLEAGFKGAGAYVPGCGHGHDAAFLAKQGLTTKAVDFVPEAITAAQSIYENAVGLSFAVEDALQRRELGIYDLVYDRAMLCALQPENRLPYVESMHYRLKSDGLLAGFIFAEVDLPPGQEGPPFGFTDRALTELLSSKFDPVCWERVHSAMPGSSIKSEWLVIWRKKK